MNRRVLPLLLLAFTLGAPFAVRAQAPAPESTPDSALEADRDTAAATTGPTPTPTTSGPADPTSTTDPTEHTPLGSDSNSASYNETSAESPTAADDTPRPPPLTPQPPSIAAPVEPPRPAWAERRIGPLWLGQASATPSDPSDSTTPPRLRLALGTQFRGTFTFPDGGDSTTRLDLHRLRPLFIASLLDDQVRFRLFIDLAPRTLEIIDAYVEVRVADGHRLRFGVDKIPFSHHWRQSYLGIPFVDWGLTTRMFGGGRQLGLSWEMKRGPFTFDAGLYMGQTLRAPNGARVSQTYAQDPRRYLVFQSPDTTRAPHPELAARLTVGDEARAVALSATWDLRPEYSRDTSLRLAIDGAIHWPIASIWAGGFFAASEQEDGAWMAAMGGLLAEGRIRLGGVIDIAARYSAVLRSGALRRDAQRFVDALQRDNPDLTDPRFDQVGRIRGEHELTLAVSAYVFGDDLKWVNEVSWLRTGGLDTDDIRVRTQVQAGF